MKNKRKSGITSLSSVKIHWNQHLPCGNIHITCTIWVMINVGRGCFTYLKFEPLWNHGWNHGKWKIMKAVPSLILLLISSYVPPEFRLWKSWTKFWEGSLTTKKKTTQKRITFTQTLRIHDDPCMVYLPTVPKKIQANVGKYMQIHHTSPILWEMISNISTKKKVETDPKAAPEMLSFSQSSSATRSKQARLLFRMVSLNKRTCWRNNGEDVFFHIRHTQQNGSPNSRFVKFHKFHDLRFNLNTIF